MFAVRTFVPGEVPSLEGWLWKAEVFGRGMCLAISCDAEGEVWVGNTSIGFATIDWGMDLKADIKELAGKKIDSVTLVSQLVGL